MFFTTTLIRVQLTITFILRNQIGQLSCSKMPVWSRKIPAQLPSWRSHFVFIFSQCFHFYSISVGRFMGWTVCLCAYRTELTDYVILITDVYNLWNIRSLEHLHQLRFRWPQSRPKLNPGAQLSMLRVYRQRWSPRYSWTWCSWPWRKFSTTFFILFLNNF